MSQKEDELKPLSLELKWFGQHRSLVWCQLCGQVVLKQSGFQQLTVFILYVVFWVMIIILYSTALFEPLQLHF